MDEQIPHAIACAVVNNKGDYLLLKRSPDKKLSPNKWFVVGAYPLSKNEDFEKFVHHELVDELGIDGKILKTGAVVESKIQGIKIMVHTFLAQVPSNDIKLNHEHTEYKWMKLEDIKNFDTVDNTYEMILGLIQ